MATLTIMCPVDLSIGSGRALRFAWRLTSHFRARLIVLHVNEPLVVGEVMAFEDLLLGDEAKKDVADFAKKALPPGQAIPEDFRVMLRLGEASAEILRAAADEKVDLVVMGTHGLSGYRKMLFGSTTERVLRYAETPVLIVPELEESPATGHLDDDLTVLAPVDFGTASVRAARIAAGIAESMNRTLLLFHVVSPVRRAAWLRGRDEQSERERFDRAERDLRTIATALPSPLTVDCVVAVGQPADEIARIARERHAGLIVMPLRQSGLPLLSPAPGAIAYRVLCQAPAPVLALPATGTCERPYLRDVLRGIIGQTLSR